MAKRGLAGWGEEAVNERLVDAMAVGSQELQVVGGGEDPFWHQQSLLMDEELVCVRQFEEKRHFLSKME